MKAVSSHFFLQECKLDFGTPFYLNRGVADADDVTSLSAIGGSAQNGAIAFATTHWSVVLTAQDESPSGTGGAGKALSHLLATYV